MVVFSIVFLPMREKNLDFPEWLIPSNLPLEFHTDFVFGTVDFVSVFCGAFWCRVFAAHPVAKPFFFLDFYFWVSLISFWVFFFWFRFGNG